MDRLSLLQVASDKVNDHIFGFRMGYADVSEIHCIKSYLVTLNLEEGEVYPTSQAQWKEHVDRLPFSRRELSGMEYMFECTHRGESPWTCNFYVSLIMKEMKSKGLRREFLREDYTERVPVILELAKAGFFKTMDCLVDFVEENRTMLDHGSGYFFDDHFPTACILGLLSFARTGQPETNGFNGCVDTLSPVIPERVCRQLEATFEDWNCQHQILEYGKFNTEERIDHLILYMKGWANEIRDISPDSENFSELSNVGLSHPNIVKYVNDQLDRKRSQVAVDGNAVETGISLEHAD